MGVSTDAYLCFGIDLGADEENEDADLLGELGDERYRECSAAEKRHGVEFVLHGADGYTCRLVCDAATVKRAHRGYPTVVTSLEAPADTATRIRAFAAELGFKIPDGDPHWILASYWG